MYSREKRMKALKLYVKYDQSAAAVIYELGYPDLHPLRQISDFVDCFNRCRSELLI